MANWPTPAHPSRQPASIFNPTEARSWPTSLIGITLMNAARDSPIAGRDLPTVVISHGNGGGLQSHADLALALASADHVVAAPMHAGDNFADRSAAGAATLYSTRTRQLHAAVDHVLVRWPEQDRIDPERVGAFGFSAGGFTVRAAAGAPPDMRLIAKHCAQAPKPVRAKDVRGSTTAAPTVGYPAPRATV